MTGEREDFFGAFKFGVSLDGRDGMSAVFSECSGFQLEMEVLEHQEGGQNGFVHKLPGRLKQANLTLKRGIVASDALLDWVLKAFAGDIQRKNVDVVLYAPDGKQARLWSLYSAYPVKWIGPALKADDNSIAVDTFELAYDELRIE